MKRTIKQEVMIRVVLTLVAVVVSGWMTVSSMGNIRGYTQSTQEATEIDALVLKAQSAHNSWVENLCSAISMGTEFTGSKDYKTCVLGNWFYGTDLSGLSDEMLDLIDENVVTEVAFLNNGQIWLTTQEDFVYVDQDGNSHDKNFTLFTMQIDNTGLTERLDTHNQDIPEEERVTYYRVYEPDRKSVV